MDDPDGHFRAAQMCRGYLDALMTEGFTRDEAAMIVAAWQSRAVMTDMAAMNAMMQNFAATITGRDE